MREHTPQAGAVDLESLFREMIRTNTAFRAEIGLNAENRVLLRVVRDDGSAGGYVIVENSAVPADIAAPTQPPVQRVAAHGFDAHKGMGSR